MKTYYEILGVQNDAEDFVIRAAYKALAQKYHPDKWTSNLEESIEKMKEINRAYEILSNHEKRRDYDENLHTHGSVHDSDNHRQTKTNQSNPVGRKVFIENFLKFFTLPIVTISIVFFAFQNLKNSESTLVALKCNEHLFLIKDAKDEINYYRITKKFMSDVPYKFYSSNPDFDLKDTPPYLSGISIDYSNSSMVSSLRRDHFAPDWYTFLTPDEESKNGLTKLNITTYINRSTLKMESKFSGDGTVWSESTCEFIDATEFEKDWRDKVTNKQKKLKF